MARCSVCGRSFKVKNNLKPRKHSHDGKRCFGSFLMARFDFEWTERRKTIKETLKCYDHINEDELNMMNEQKGWTDDEMFEVMVEMGFTIGRTKSHQNEWWAPRFSSGEKTPS